MYHIKQHNVKPSVPLTPEPMIAPTAEVIDTAFGSYCEIQAHCSITESIIGDYSYVCEYGQVIYTEIGKFSNIAAHCRVNPGFHPMERPTLHHFTYRLAKYGFSAEDDKEFFDWRRRQKVLIGHDTWIGHGAVIMPGVKIGNGAVIGSLSVVTKNIPAYTVAVGSPARVIRRRFPVEIAEAVEKTAWWDWDHNTIKERMDDFKDIRRFLAKYAQ